MAERFDPSDPGPDALAFLTERHLATLSIVKPDGVPQVTPVGFTYQPDRALTRVITWADSYKARLIARTPGQPVAVCQVDGGRWLTINGLATVTDDATAVDEAVRRYTERYRPPKQRTDRVVIEIAVDRLMGRA